MPVSSYTLAEIELTERQRLEQPLLIVILLGTASFSLAEEPTNVFYLFAAILAVGANYLAVRHNKEIYLSRRWVNVAVLAATALVAVEFASANYGEPVLVVGHFMVLIQLCKLFEKKRDRDYVQLLALNLLLMVTTALLTTAMWFAVVLVVYIVLFCYVASVFTLKRGLDRAAEAHLSGEPGPLSPRQVAWNVSRDWPARALRRALVRVVIPTFLAAMVAFLVIPRATRAMSMGLNRTGLGASTDQKVRLGGRKEIYVSDALAVWVQIETEGAVGPAVYESSRYMRQSIMDAYEDSTWSNAQGPSRFRQHIKDMPIPSETIAGPRVVHHVSMRPGMAQSSVAPFPSVHLEYEGGTRGRVSDELEFGLNFNLAPGQTVEYEVESFAQPLSPAQKQWLDRRVAPPVSGP